MIMYSVLFEDGSRGCEFRAKDANHARQLAEDIYPHLEIYGEPVPSWMLGFD